ncbi:unnamed protein product [Rhizoctonia solani]|uniref:Uncharacterized protein n=1 Tax=Rhizoctonia solani TaxID=456999 RepID=A0A8H3DT49_9AGAM|nr:unnamed protein product [Rhizoctonia solani]
MADYDFISYKALRREPPTPLGEVNYFSVSAATPPGATHTSGTSLRLKLDNPNPDSPFRSSQLINGRVHIQSSKALQSPKLSVRVYFESRTLFWSLELKDGEHKFDQTMSMIKNSSALTYENVMRHEVHRGVVPVTMSDIEQIEPDCELVLPFSFIVPRKMVVTEWRDHPSAPRDLCAVERCPPSTLRDSRYGSVQWIVEAVLDIAPSPTRNQDPDTLLRQSTDEQVVSRIAFPFMPSAQDVVPLLDEPFFGQDMRKDAFGSKRLSEEEIESGKKAVMERVRTRGGRWEAHVKQFPAGKSTMWSELYTPVGALVSTDTATLPLILFLKHTGAQSSLKSLFRAAKPKPVHLRRALVTLLRTISTRGGKETRPHVRNTPVREQEFLFDSESSSSSSCPGLAISYEDPNPVELDLTLDLQSDLPSGNHPCIPIHLCTPSFRTPNFQHEYLLTVSVWFVEDEIDRFVSRFPVQILPAAEEDGNQLPAFEEAVGGDAPPTFDESVGAL